MNSKPRVLIVGASIAGLATATALSQTGLVEVSVYERSNGIESDIRRPRNGGGVGLEHESIQILKRLGVTDLVSLPMPFEEERDRNGRLIRKGRIPLHSAYWGDVQKSLSKCGQEGGILVHYGKTLSRVDETQDGVKLEFSDGTTTLGDCLIGADGILSTVRTFIFPKNDLIRHAGYFAWRGVLCLNDLPVELKSEAEATFPKETLLFHISERSHAVFYYLPEVLNWLVYLNRNENGDPTYHDGSNINGNVTKVPTGEELESFYQTVERLYSPTLVKIFRATDGPFINEIYDRDTSSTFHSGRCVLIGDAAHPATPHYLRGTNMAIQDAYSLSQAFVKILGQAQTFSPAKLEAIFKIYEGERLNYCNNVVTKAKRIGRVKQGVFSASQNLGWDLTCTSSELSDLLQDNVLVDTKM